MTNRQTSPLLLFLGFAALGAACQKNQPVTEIILEIGTNIPVPAEIDAISLKISSSNSNDAALDRPYSLVTGPDKVTLPSRMTLVPAGTGATITVRVDGLLAGTVIVSRTAITSFVQDKSVLLRIDLLRECEGKTCPAADQTCVSGGVCTDANIPPGSLPPFDPSKSPALAPPDRDAGTPSAGKDGQAADGPPGAGGDGPPNLTDAARDLGADGPPNLTDAASDLGADGLGAAPSDGANDGPSADGLPGAVGDGPPNLADTASGLGADGPVATDSSLPDVPASKPNGAACTSKAECQSGICADGFCCNSDCSGTCMSCKVSGSAGTCSLVPLNDSSDGDCPVEGARTCGRNGMCDGAGGCMRYPSGTECSAETCPAGSSTHTRPGLCDGHGVCAAGQVLDCAPYMCNAAINACYAICTTAGSECKPPGQCTNGSCGKKSNGQTCTQPSECTSNFCEQGVCCGGPCQVSCMSCAVEGSLGTCSPVKPGNADPQKRCGDLGVASCGTNGSCDGSGACQKYAAGLQCQATCDPNSATLSVSTCNGSGTCGPPNPQACTPYNCDPSGCKKLCTVQTDCARGYVCSPSGTCVPPEDCMNGIDDDGNGQVDCADQACINAGYTCVPQVPSGFTGPGEVYDGPGPSPACGPLYPTDYFTGFATPQCPFTCGDCKCGDPGTGTCGDPGFWSTTVIGAACLGKTLAEPPGRCVTIAEKVTKFFTTAPVGGGGSCTPGSGVLSPQDPIWNTGHLCQANAKAGGGCAPGLVCWPKSQASFLPQACVFAGGDQSCPATGYTVKRSYYENQKYSDTRACSTSTCVCTPHVSCSGGYLDIYSSPSCTGSFPTPIAVPSPCQAMPTTAVSMEFTDSTPTVGNCTATGTATPAGGCIPVDDPNTPPATACCTPPP